MSSRKPRLPHRESEQTLLENCFGREYGQRRESYAESTSSSNSSEFSITTSATEQTRHRGQFSSTPSRNPPLRFASNSQPVPLPMSNTRILSNGRTSSPPSTPLPLPPPQPPTRRTPPSREPRTNGALRASNERSRCSSRPETQHVNCLLQRKVLITFSIVAFLASLVSVAVLAMVFYQPFAVKWENRTFPEGSYETCVKCVHLKQKVEDDKDVEENMKELRNKIQDGELDCCASTGRQLSALLKLVLKQHRRTIVYKDPCAEEMRNTPVAHKSLRPSDVNFSVKSAEGGKEKLMKINTGEDREQIARKVKPSDNMLIIQVSGWYYVYSSIYLSFVNKESHCTSAEYKSWHLSIQRMSSGIDEFEGVLTRAHHSCCQNCSNEKESVFAGGIFKLLQGDVIFVTVSSAKAVILDDESTFLGLMMLGSEPGKV